MTLYIHASSRGEKSLAMRRHGFTFTEILFAIMILGIGFIMVAAMFPVAIRQTQTTVELTTASTIGKDAGTLMNRIAPPFIESTDPTTYCTNFPATTPNVPPPALPVLQTVVVANTGPQSSVQFPSPGGGPPKAMITRSFWSALQGNLIYATDTRFAFVPLYIRGMDPNTATPGADGTIDPRTAKPYKNAQVIIIVVQARNASNFTSADLVSFTTSSGATAPPNLQARPLTAVFTSNSNGPDTVTFSPDSASNNMIPPDTGYGLSDPSMVGEGTYVVVSDDSLTYNWLNRKPQFSCAGTIYRVGNKALSSTGSEITNTWELMPGNDMKNAAYPPTYGETSANDGSGSRTSKAVRVFVVGRGYADAKAGNASFIGPAMDVAAFSTFVKAQ